MASIAFSSGIYTFTGPGFYAILESDTNRTIHKIGYVVGSKRIRSVRPFVADVLGLSAIFGGELPAFLFTLYRGGVELANPDVEHDLDADIRAAGLDFSLGVAGYVEGQYDKVEALDFCVLTGRKDYPYEKMIKHLRLEVNADPDNPGEFIVTERPPLNEVPNNETDIFLNAIKHLGISGIIARMYAREAMTWEEYLECASHFWLGDIPRITVEIGRLQFLLVNLLRPSLTQERRNQLMLIAAGIPYTG